MTFCFVFAHPDDETVACAGTMHQLVEAGHTVYVLLATPGDAGELAESARQQYPDLPVDEIRKKELEHVQKHIGWDKHIFLGFNDGQITNQRVWADLKEEIKTQLTRFKPDFVVTFDHSGWYFHLDHVGVSIATTLAVQEIETPPQGLLLSHFRPGDGTKWPYIYSESMPITHQVEVTDTEHKLTAVGFHQSQNLQTVVAYIETQETHHEYYQLALAQEKAEQLLQDTTIFRHVSA